MRKRLERVVQGTHYVSPDQQIAKKKKRSEGDETLDKPKPVDVRDSLIEQSDIAECCIYE